MGFIYQPEVEWFDYISFTPTFSLQAADLQRLSFSRRLLLGNYTFLIDDGQIYKNTDQ